MEIKLEGYLKDLKASLLEMGGSVEKVIQLAAHAIEMQTAKDINQILDEEKRINAIHMRLDEDCFKIIARQAPKAIDLRRIIAIMKVNNELERMGDLARNISLAVQDLVDGANPILLRNEIVRLSVQVRQMVSQSLDSMTKDDDLRAHDVLRTDNIVDQMKDELCVKLKEAMKQNPEYVEAGVDLISIVRNLERIADHATNIAEDVIFVRSGQDIRHGVKGS